MKLRTLGNSGIKISPIILGTWQAGKDMWVGIDDARTTGAIRAAFEAGITTFDTAEVYGNGIVNDYAYNQATGQLQSIHSSLLMIDAMRHLEYQYDAYQNVTLRDDLINDIRFDLSYPDLPFVVANTGIGGGMGRATTDGLRQSGTDWASGWGYVPGSLRTSGKSPEQAWRRCPAAPLCQR